MCVNHKARVSRVPGSGAGGAPKSAQAAGARGFATADADSGEPGMGVRFAHDALANGRAIRVLTVEDEYTRESLALPVDTSFASRRVTRELERILAEREKPLAIRCDNVLTSEC